MYQISACQSDRERARWMSQPCPTGRVDVGTWGRGYVNNNRTAVLDIDPSVLPLD